MCNAVAIKMPS